MKANRQSLRGPRASGDIEGKLVTAAEDLMRSQGLARITTRDLAKKAGLAEGTLYNHFREKDEIFVSVLKRNVAELSHVLQDLPLRVGQATVLENLSPVAEAAIGFHVKVAPLICSLFADQNLMSNIRRVMQERRIGPQRSLESLAAYISAEQRLGRVVSDVDAAAVAALILGVSFQTAVFHHFWGNRTPERELKAQMRKAIQATVLGLAPRDGRATK